MLIAIEGIDGSGKGTQSELLKQRAHEEGLRAALFSFPRYGNNAFGRAVGQYLDGAFGQVKDVPPELAALLYAGDRFAAKEELLAALKSHDLVICDRYVPSNLAHQAAKLPREVRATFINWISEIEYGLYQLPRPDAVVLLNIPVSTAARLVLRKKPRDYTNRVADIHEADQQYLLDCTDVYQHLLRSSPREPWFTVSVTSSRGDLRVPADISAEIWSTAVSGATLARHAM